MKYFVAYLLVCSLVGSALCARLRRQAPASGGAPPPPPEAAEQGGAPAGLTTPGSTKVKDPDSAMGFILGDLKNQQSFGVPVSADKVGGIVKTANGISVLGADTPALGVDMAGLGLEISDPNKEGIAGLATAPPLADDEAAAGGAPPA